MVGPYTTQEIDGHTRWFNADGAQVAHYPDMLLHGVLRRTLDVAARTGRLEEAQLAIVEDEMAKAWPMQADDSPAQFSSRQHLVMLFSFMGLLPSPTTGGAA